MKRFLIFMLLGPFLAVVILVFATWLLQSPSMPDGYALIFLVPATLVFGPLAGLAAAWVDRTLPSLEPETRALVTSLGGFAATVLVAQTLRLVLPLMGLPGDAVGTIREVLAFAVLGVMSAAICSWLSGYKHKSRAELQRERDAM